MSGHLLAIGVELVDQDGLDALGQVHDVAGRADVHAVLQECSTDAVIGALAHVGLGVDAIAPHDGVLAQAGRDVSPGLDGGVFRECLACELAIDDFFHVVLPVDQFVEALLSEVLAAQLHLEAGSGCIGVGRAQPLKLGELVIELGFPVLAALGVIAPGRAVLAYAGDTLADAAGGQLAGELQVFVGVEVSGEVNAGQVGAVFADSAITDSGTEKAQVCGWQECSDEGSSLVEALLQGVALQVVGFAEAADIALEPDVLAIALDADGGVGARALNLLPLLDFVFDNAVAVDFEYFACFQDRVFHVGLEVMTE